MSKMEASVTASSPVLNQPLPTMSTSLRSLLAESMASRHTSRAVDESSHPEYSELSQLLSQQQHHSTDPLRLFPQFPAIPGFGRLFGSRAFAGSSQDPLFSSQPIHMIAHATATPVVSAPETQTRRSSRLASRMSREAELSTPSAHCSSGASEDHTKVARAASAAPVRRKREHDAQGAENTPNQRKKRRASLKKAPPNAKKDITEDNFFSKEDDKQAAEDTTSCCICMCEPEREELSTINGCEHMFCFECISKWSDRENTCPLCKARFSKIDRVHHQARKKGGPKITNSKRVEKRDQRADLLVPGAALEGLLASLAASGGGRLGHLMVTARMSNNSRSSRSTTRLRSIRVDMADTQIYDSEDDDNDFIPNFMQAIMRSGTSARILPVGTAFGASPPVALAPFSSMTTAWPTVHATMAAPIPAVAAIPTTAMAPPPVVPRSYATNSFDQMAGRAAENPLEIDDSDEEDPVNFSGFGFAEDQLVNDFLNLSSDDDEDDDDEDGGVEVVQVTRPL